MEATEREVRVRREGVQFGFDDDLSCAKCGQDLDLTDSCRNRVRPTYCPRCGGKLIWESSK